MGVGEIIYLSLHNHHQNDSCLRWAAIRAILMFHNCEGQSHKTASTDHNFWGERRAEADSNRGPSAYQPKALLLGQSGSQDKPTIIGGSCYKYHFFVATKIFLCRQKTLCRDKRRSVATKDALSRQKTKMILVSVLASDSLGPIARPAAPRCVTVTVSGSPSTGRPWDRDNLSPHVGPQRHHSWAGLA